MKKIAMLLAFLFSLLTGVKAADVQYLVINLTDGTKAEIALADQPVITLSGGELKVTVAGEEKVSAALDDVVNYKFTTSPTSIQQIQVNEREQSRYAQGHVLISKAQAGATVRVFTADGRQVLSREADQNGFVDIDLTVLGKGLYIIKSTKASIKVINK